MRPVYEDPGFRLDISGRGRDVTSGLIATSILPFASALEHNENG